MAADALPRVDTAPLLAPAQPAQRPSRPDRSDYSDRLTRRVTREAGASRPASPSERGRIKSQASGKWSSGPTSAQTRGKGTAEPESAAGDGGGAAQAGDEIAAPTSSSGESQAAAATSPGTDPKAAATAGPAEGPVPADEDAAADELDVELYSLVPVPAVPPPPWSVIEAPEALGPAAVTAAAKGPVEAPAAVLELLVGGEAPAEPVEPAALAQTRDETPVPPTGFVEAVVPAETDPVPPEPVAETTTQVSDTPVATWAPSDELITDATAPAPVADDTPAPAAATEIDTGVGTPVETVAVELSLPTAEEPSDDVSLDAAAGQQPEETAATVFVDAGPTTTSENDVEVEGPGEAPPPETAADDAPIHLVPVDAVTAEAEQVAADHDHDSAQPRPARDTSSDAASAAASDHRTDHRATEGKHSEVPLAAGRPDWVPPATGTRPSEVGSSHRAAAAGQVQAVAGEDLVSHAASALRAADGLDRPIRIRLTPPELGALRVEVSRVDGHVSARFEVTTAAAHSALHDHLSALRESLGRAGVSVERIEVRLAEPSREDGRSDGGGEGQSQQQGFGEERRQRDERRGSTPGGTDGDSNVADDRRSTRTAGRGQAARQRASAADLIDVQV